MNWISMDVKYDEFLGVHIILYINSAVCIVYVHTFSSNVHKKNIIKQTV